MHAAFVRVAINRALEGVFGLETTACGNAHEDDDNERQDVLEDGAHKDAQSISLGPDVRTVRVWRTSSHRGIGARARDGQASCRGPRRNRRRGIRRRLRTVFGVELPVPAESFVNSVTLRLTPRLVTRKFGRPCRHHRLAPCRRDRRKPQVFPPLAADVRIPSPNPGVNSAVDLL